MTVDCALSATGPCVANETQKHYFTFQTGYAGTAVASARGTYGHNEAHIDVATRFNGRIEFPPTEMYNIPTSPDAQVKQVVAMQAAVVAQRRERRF